MQLSIRVAFAAVLWACALVPLSLLVLATASPEAAVGLANGLGWAIRWILSAAVLATAAGSTPSVLASISGQLTSAATGAPV